VGRLHRVLDDGHEVERQRVELDLGAQTAGELRDGVLGVVAAAVEAAVDEVLDARAQGPKAATTASVDTATISGESSCNGRTDCRPSTAKR